MFSSIYFHHSVYKWVLLMLKVCTLRSRLKIDNNKPKTSMRLILIHLKKTSARWCGSEVDESGDAIRLKYEIEYKCGLPIVINARLILFIHRIPAYYRRKSNIELIVYPAFKHSALCKASPSTSFSQTLPWVSHDASFLCFSLRGWIATCLAPHWV